MKKEETMSDLKDLIIQAKSAIKESKNIEELESIRIEFLGKRGNITLKTKRICKLDPEKRPSEGAKINLAKKEIQNSLRERKITLESEVNNSHIIAETLDVSLPGRNIDIGGLHPITITLERVKDFFSKMGFSIITGPDIEDDYHNFDALNIPDYHPARNDRDTFWFDKKRLLRTQTSGMQIRTMLSQKPPMRILSPGRVYRKDQDQTHTPMFHQVEGLMIDTNVSLADLKGTLYEFIHNFFEKDLSLRFRPSYFPFTEPSAEIDIMWKNNYWLEVLGCGMVHANVLRHVEIDPDCYSGFAFGIGIERLAMLYYGILDLRTFFQNDLRFLKQFK